MTGETPLVSTEWLAARLGTPKIRIADASWYLPQAGRNAHAEHEAAHIPGAVFFDIDALSDRATDLPHMLPSPEAFASGVRQLGIGDADFIVFYDGAGIYSAPRGLWMMRAMGHRMAAVLDGGLPKWRREGRPVERSAAALARVGRRHFTPSPSENWYVISVPCRATFRVGMSRSWTRAAPRDSAARSRSRGPECGLGTSQER